MTMTDQQREARPDVTKGWCIKTEVGAYYAFCVTQTGCLARLKREHGVATAGDLVKVTRTITEGWQE